MFYAKCTKHHSQVVSDLKKPGLLSFCAFSMNKLNFNLVFFAITFPERFAA